MPGKKGFAFLILTVFALLLLVRLLHLSADPPYDLSTSGGPYGDPGGYSFNARNKILFGTWEVDDYNMMYLSSPPHIVTYLTFRLMGVGLAQQNLVPVLFSLGSLVLFFLILRRRFSNGWALGGTALLGINYLFLMFSRVANRVMPPLFFILLGLFLLQKERREAGTTFAAGASLFLALISKSVVFYVVAALGFGYLIFIILHEPLGKIAKRTGLLIAGAVSLSLPWFFFIYLPHRDYIHSFTELNKNYLIPPDNLSLLLRYFWTRPSILLEEMPFLSVLAAVASLILLLKIFEECKKIPLVDWIFLAWFMFGYLYYAIIQQRVTRHYIPQIVPLVFLAVFLGNHFLSGRTLKKKKFSIFLGLLVFLWMLFPASLALKYFSSLFPQFFSSQRSLNLTLVVLSAAAVVILLVFLKALSKTSLSFFPPALKKSLVILLFSAVFIFQGTKYLEWTLHPRFQFKEISQDLGKAFSNAVIAGLWAPAVCLENKHRAHEYFPGYINDYKDFFQRFGITHVFTTTAFGEHEKFERNFPEVMRRAFLLARYHIWTVEALLYDVRPPFRSRPWGLFEAELYTEKGSTPRFDPEASGRFAVLCRSKQPGYAVIVPVRTPLEKGTYKISFRLKKPDFWRGDEKKMARIDAVSEKRRNPLGSEDIFFDQFSSPTYQDHEMTIRLSFSQMVKFRVYSQGNGSFWVDRIELRKIE